MLLWDNNRLHYHDEYFLSNRNLKWYSDVILKGTRVNGVYDSRAKANPKKIVFARLKALCCFH